MYVHRAEYILLASLLIAPQTFLTAMNMASRAPSPPFAPQDGERLLHANTCWLLPSLVLVVCSALVNIAPTVLAVTDFDETDREQVRGRERGALKKR